MTIYGCARVSTDGQTLDTQVSELRVAADQPSISRTRWHPSLRAALLDGPEGFAEVRKSIRLLPTAAALQATGHTQDPTGRTPLSLNLEALEDRSEALDFLLVDALVNADAGKITVESDTWFVRFAPARAEGSRIVLEPRIRALCSCFAFLDRSEKSLRVSWVGPRGRQSATAEQTVIVAPSWTEISWACVRLAILILLARAKAKSNAPTLASLSARRR